MRGVLDSELEVHGYDLFRCNRPVSCKGGGVLLYVKEELQAIELKLKNSFPEQVWCCIGEKGRDEVLVGICYRTPMEKVYDVDIHAELKKMLQ